MTTAQEVVIDRIILIVSDLDRVEEDYVRMLGCSVEQRDDIEPLVTRVLGMPHMSGRRSLLQLGRQRIELLEFVGLAGQIYPPDSTSTDLWFQHMAIVVSDMAYAHERVMRNPRFRPISRHGPVRLPDSSGGVTAFKFRDYDGHPLELIAFPDGHVPKEWRDADGIDPFLGIDHTGIAVGDLPAATRFLTSVFGLSLGAVTDNHGPEQGDLDDLDDAHVGVTSVGPNMPPPRIELLHYHVGTRRPIPRDSVSTDIAATHSVARVPSMEATSAALARYGMPLEKDDIVVLRDGRRAAMVRGPEGRRFLVEEAGTGPDPPSGRHR